MAGYEIYRRRRLFWHPHCTAYCKKTEMKEASVGVTTRLPQSGLLFLLLSLAMRSPSRDLEAHRHTHTHITFSLPVGIAVKKETRQLAQWLPTSRILID